ncbi:unnamed protein product [Somion occarium]|uniref:Phospholipase A-2-activating protein n=1 Tax=Somion occarium TaxID=3059160 RepID=A0ABP1DCL6_9APHY
MPYKLSTTLRGHKGDVRAVCSPRDDLILSASRDTTAIYWTRQSSDAAFTKSQVFKPGQRFVSSVTYIPPLPEAPQGYVVTGGQDALVNVYNVAVSSERPEYILIGHEQNVCSLSAAPDGTIISGSWDQTAKVWKGFEKAYELLGHEQSVWAVIAIDPSQFLTGSADNTIKLWHQNKAVKTFTGHTQAVRGLALIPEIGFASCANDGTIRVWTMEGDIVHILSGHTSFVYSLAVTSRGDIISGGEDRTVRIWRDGECVQSIVHPAISVWAVSTLPNTDIVTGCSDGLVRVFSRVEERWASDEEVRNFEVDVAAHAVPAPTVGGVKVNTLPGMDALITPGLKSGDVKMINNRGVGEVYQWDGIRHKWEKVGNLTDAPGTSNKQTFEGKQYDYVFDVDIQEGAPSLKLPYNITENPYTAAQRFLERNDLPMHFLDQVVSFIQKSAESVTLGSSATAPSDPFTGASRYQASQGAPASSGDFMDPFTVSSLPAPLSTAEPWSGASRPANNAAAAASPQTQSAAKLPVHTPHLFLQANIPAMQAKLHQFNDLLRQEISASSAALYNRDLSYLDDMFSFLTKISATPPTQPNFPVTPNHIEVLIHLLIKWPSAQRFPVLDLSRLIIAHAPESYAEPEFTTRFFNALFEGAEWSQPWTPLPLPKFRETNILLLFRALANAFKDDSTIGDGAWIKLIFEKIQQAPYAAFTKPQTRMTLSTIYFNMSCRGVREQLDPGLRSALLALVLSVLQNETEDAETAYRALVALGNIVYAAKQFNSPLQPTQESSARAVLNTLPATFAADVRVRNLSQDILALL